MRTRVHGTPQQQGSKNQFGAESNAAKLKPWRASVAQAVGEAWGGKPALLGPVRISVTFGFMRPKAHYRTGKNAHILRDDAPTYKTSTPDGDKLARAIGDALTGVVYKDDSQIQWGFLEKVYDTTSYADITIIDLAGGSHDTGRNDDLGGGAHSPLRDLPAAQ
jgi:Holliday junction resolvase RusA-like endonuclease